MFFYTSKRVHSHGKAFLADRKLKNMLTSKRRRKRSRLKICARTLLMNSRNSCITAEVSHSLRILTTVTSSVCLKAA